MFNHCLGSQLQIPMWTLLRIPMWKVRSCQSCHDRWPLLKPLVVTISPKLKYIFLAELVKEYQVIEEKEYYSRMLDKKKRAWLKVLDKSNAEFPSTPKRALRC